MQSWAISVSYKSPKTKAPLIGKERHTYRDNGQTVCLSLREASKVPARPEILQYVVNGLLSL